MILYCANKFLGMADVMVRTFGRDLPLLGFQADVEVQDWRAELDTRRNARKLPKLNRKNFRSHVHG